MENLLLIKNINSEESKEYMENLKKKTSVAKIEEKKDLEYTVGLRIHGFSNEYLHMSLAFIGKLNQEKINDLKESAELLAKEILPIRFVLDKEGMLGSNFDVPVRYAKVIDEQKKKTIIDFYCDYADSTDEHFHGREGPNFHVTLKKCEKELLFGTEIESKEIFLKPLGKHDPIWSYNC